MGNRPISIAIENLSDKVMNIELFKEIDIYNGGDYIDDYVRIRAGGCLNYQQLLIGFKVQPSFICMIQALSFTKRDGINYSNLVIKNKDKEDIILEPTKKYTDFTIIDSGFYTDFTIDSNTRIDINGLEPKAMIVILFYPSDNI